MNRHSCLLLEPAKCPNIVIANEEMHLYALVRNLLDGLQERTILLFAPILPKELAPKIKDISEQIDSSRILRHEAKHGDKRLLVGLEIRDSP